MGGTHQPLARIDDARAQLESLISTLDAKDQKLVRAVRSAMRKRLPTANELVYQYTDAVVIGYTPNEQPIDGIVAIKALAGDMRLYFLLGAKLPDPTKILQGSAKGARFIRVDSGRTLTQPAVEALMNAAIKQSKVPLPATGRGKLIIRSIGKKKRPQRKAAK